MTDTKMASEASKPVVTPVPAKEAETVKTPDHAAAPVVVPATAK